jgi:hypothetical protein
MLKYIVGAILIILIGAGAYYMLSGGTEDQVPQNNEPIVQQPITQTYASSSFSVTYPTGWAIDEAYKYTGVSESKPIGGVKMTIPGSMATGTNLSADTYIAVEQLPRASICTADIYLLANVRANTMTLGAKTWSVASSSGAGAGNLYEEIVHAIPDSSPCTAVRYYIHSTQIANYPAGTVSEFDRTLLMMEFDKIRDSVMLNTTPTEQSLQTP